MKKLQTEKSEFFGLGYNNISYSLQTPVHFKLENFFSQRCIWLFRRQELLKQLKMRKLKHQIH